MQDHDVLYAYGKAAAAELQRHGVSLHTALDHAALNGSDRQKIAAVAAVYAQAYDAERTKEAMAAGFASKLTDVLSRPFAGASAVASAGGRALNNASERLSEPSLAAKAVDLLTGTDVGTRIREGVANVAGAAGDFLSGAANKVDDLAEDVTRLGVKTDAQRFEDGRAHLPHWMMEQHLQANDLRSRPLTPDELPAQITSRDIANRVNTFIRNRGLTGVSDFLQKKIDTYLPAWKPPVRPFYIDGPDGKRFRVVLDD